MNKQVEFEGRFSVADVDKDIRTQNTSFKYTLADVILILLYAHNKPIRGKTKQMKEVFLVLNEVLPKENIQRIDFVPHRLGPYSEEVEYTINNLLMSNYITTSGKKTTNDFAIELTNKGKQYIRTKFLELPDHIKERLRTKRLEWDTHSTQGILNLVYTNYDKYLEKSVLKKRFAKIDWDDEGQKPE